MNYYLYFIIFGALIVICMVYARFASRRAGKVHNEAVVGGYTVEELLHNPLPIREELLNNPEWFLHIRQQLQPEQIIAFTQCAPYQGLNEKAIQLAKWIFWWAITTYRNQPEQYTCYLILTDKALHYLHYDADDECTQHLVFDKALLKDMAIEALTNLKLQDRIWHANQTGLTGDGYYRLSFSNQEGKTEHLIYMDSIQLYAPTGDSQSNYRRMAELQVMARYFDQQIRQLPAIFPTNVLTQKP